MPDKRILIVEDETIVAMTIEDALQTMGYAVVGTVSTSEDAIKMAGTTRPDLILMDIRIQGEKDGIATAEEITAMYHIPIVYLTAHADETTFRRAMKTQPYGYLTKPFRDRELHSTIEMLCTSTGSCSSGMIRRRFQRMKDLLLFWRKNFTIL